MSLSFSLFGPLPDGMIFINIFLNNLILDKRPMKNKDIINVKI